MTTKDVIREFISSADQSWRKARANPGAFVDEFVTRHRTHSDRLESAMPTTLRNASKVSKKIGIEKLEEVWTLVKKNRGHKIILATANRQYAAFMERVKEVNSSPRFGAGINRHGVEDERALRGRSSEPLGPEFCTRHREVRGEA